MQLQSIRIYIAMVAIGSIEHSLGKSGFEIELIEAQDFHSGVKTKRDSVPKHEKITFLFLLLILEVIWRRDGLVEIEKMRSLSIWRRTSSERGLHHISLEFIRIHQRGDQCNSLLLLLHR